MQDYSYIAAIDHGRFVQLCSVINGSQCGTFTELMIQLCSSKGSAGKDIFAWCCDNYDIAYRAWLDFTRNE